MTTTTSLFRESEGEAIGAGTAIFKAGDPAEHLFVVKSGAVEIKLGDKVLERVGPGGMFGEMALIDDRDRSADAIAAEDSLVVPIDKKRFEFLITETPFFARTVLKVLVERLRNETREVACT